MPLKSSFLETKESLHPAGSSFPLLISASDDNTVQVVDISSGTVLRTLLGAQDIVFSIAHTYGYVGGQVSLIVFTGSRDKVVRVYNAEEGTLLNNETLAAAASNLPRSTHD
jgi:WD40 repeat protein